MSMEPQMCICGVYELMKSAQLLPLYTLYKSSNKCDNLPLSHNSNPLSCSAILLTSCQLSSTEASPIPGNVSAKW